jgi:Putative lumazine-binding
MVSTVSQAVAGPVAPDRETRHAIEQLVALYHEGIHLGDTDRLGRVFHPEARLFGQVAGKPYLKTRAEYLDIVRGRVSPAAAGHPPGGALLSLDVRGAIAVAVVLTPVSGVDYIDFLSLVRTTDGWRVASKLFTEGADRAGRGADPEAAG